MPAENEQEVYIGSTHRVSLSGVTFTNHDGTKAYQNVGACAFSLKAAGVEVASGVMDYVAASNGRYVGTLAAATTAALTKDRLYHLFASFSQGVNEMVLHAALRARNRA